MDREIGERLVGELAQMRGHFDQSIESLRTEMRSEFAEVRGEIAEVRGGLAEVRGEFAEVRGEIAEVRGGLAEVRGEIGEVRGEIGEVRGGLAENRRHFDVLAEDLQSKIQLVAEGVVGVRSELHQFRTEVNQRFTEMEAGNRLAYAELDTRLRRVEER